MMTTLSAPPPIVRRPDLDDEAVDDEKKLGRLENLKQLEPDATASSQQDQDIRDNLIDSLVSEPGKDPFASSSSSHQILHYINEHLSRTRTDEQLEHDTILTPAAYRAG